MAAATEVMAATADDVRDAGVVGPIFGHAGDTTGTETGPVADIERYALGTLRSMAQYEASSGVDLAQHALAPGGPALAPMATLPFIRRSITFLSMPTAFANCSNFIPSSNVPPTCRVSE